MIPVAELEDQPIDKGEALGRALALLVADLPIWRANREKGASNARLAYVDSVLWNRFEIRAEVLAQEADQGRDRKRLRTHNWCRLKANLDGTRGIQIYEVGGYS